MKKKESLASSATREEADAQGHAVDQVNAADRDELDTGNEVVLENVTDRHKMKSPIKPHAAELRIEEEKREHEKQKLISKMQLEDLERQNQFAEGEEAKNIALTKIHDSSENRCRNGSWINSMEIKCTGTNGTASSDQPSTVVVCRTTSSSLT